MRARSWLGADHQKDGPEEGIAKQCEIDPPNYAQPQNYFFLNDHILHESSFSPQINQRPGEWPTMFPVQQIVCSFVPHYVFPPGDTKCQQKPIAFYVDTLPRKLDVDRDFRLHRGGPSKQHVWFFDRHVRVVTSRRFVRVCCTMLHLYAFAKLTAPPSRHAEYIILIIAIVLSAWKPYRNDESIFDHE